jgi:Zn finger protein HypA/HybF involved in hydrogenase expression
MSKETVHVKCHKCGYEWDTESLLIMVSCPSCGNKTPRVKEEE